MATRIVTRIVDDTTTEHQRHAKIVYDPEWQEYRVKQYVHAELVGTYHTDDKNDALATARAYVFTGR